MEKTIEDKEKLEKKEAINRYEPSEIDEDARKMVYDRYSDMKEGRQAGDTNWEDEWDNADKAYESSVETMDSDDWRSNLHIPIEFSLTQTVLKEMIEIPSTFYTSPVGEEDDQKSLLMNEIIKVALKKGKWAVVKNLLDHSRIVRGTAVGKVTYRQEKRTIKELTKFNQDDPTEEVYKEKEISDFDDAYIKFIDLWFFYIDEMARNIDDARDCIEREVIHIDEFKRLYGKYPNSKYVVAGGDTSMYQYYEPPSDSTNEDVEVLHYWNKPNDQYIIVANDVVIRNKPMPYDHKQLPFFVLYGFRDPNNFYGKGIPYVVKHLVDELNTLRNLRIDFQHMSHDKMFLVSDQLEVEEEDLMVRPHGMVPVSTSNMPLQNYIMPIEYGDIKPSSAKDIDYILEDIRRAVGIDDRIDGVSTGGTATEAAILKEVSMKSIRMLIVGAETDGLIRAGELFIKTIQQYYPLIKVKQIVGGKEKEGYRTIRLKNQQLMENQEGNIQLEKSEGYSFFEAKPEYIRGQYDVFIEASPMPYISKPMQQGKITEMLATFTSTGMIEKIDLNKATERYLAIHDENPKEWMKETVSPEEEKMLADQENQQMAGGNPLPPTENVSPNHTEVHMMFIQGPDGEILPPEVQDMFHQHIMGEDAKHGGGARVPVKGKGINPSKKISPKAVLPAKMTGGEKVSEGGMGGGELAI